MIISLFFSFSKRVNVIRRSYRQQLADAITQISSQHQVEISLLQSSWQVQRMHSPNHSCTLKILLLHFMTTIVAQSIWYIMIFWWTRWNLYSQITLGEHVLGCQFKWCSIPVTATFWSQVQGYLNDAYDTPFMVIYLRKMQWSGLCFVF